MDRRRYFIKSFKLIGDVIMDTSFEKTDGNDEWLTPPEIVESLGPFDIDPCSPINRPWDTANIHYTKLMDGLSMPWHGRIWCNPPYGRETGKWLKKCSEHQDCIALIFARTETRYFFNYVWDKAVALFFFKGRLKFYDINGNEGGNAGSPSVLIAYDKANAIRLQNFNMDGKFIWINDSRR